MPYYSRYRDREDDHDSEDLRCHGCEAPLANFGRGHKLCASCEDEAEQEFVAMTKAQKEGA